MDTRLIANLSDVSLCLVALYISVRSFDVYTRFRYLRLFILGLSMVLVSLSAAADFTSSYIKVVTLNTDWFIYIGQTVGFLFILLSLVRSSDTYLRGLMLLNIWTFPPLLVLLFLSPVLPGIHNTLILTLLGGSRFLICSMISIAYFSAFMRKSTRFSMLMSVAFFLLYASYLIAFFGQSLASSRYFLGDLGDITGVIGLVVLVAAVSWE